jgi:hypothetical protein
MRVAEHVVDLMNGAGLIAIEPVSWLRGGGRTCDPASTFETKPRACSARRHPDVPRR